VTQLGCFRTSLVLAAVGLFGVMSYIAAQRTTETGIRVALGAKREQVMRKMLLVGIRPAVFGLVVGLAASPEAGLSPENSRAKFSNIHFTVGTFMILFASITLSG
jgi:ABC-type antimicrobial peptide transport system permease subunit